MKAEQLRKSILQMAIQGKLVPQDSNDEPASVLLEKIRTEKQRLIKEGKIKKDKVDSVIFKGEDNRHYEKVGNEIKDITDEISFELPDGWEYIRLSTIGELYSGYTPKQNELALNGEIPYFKVSDMNTVGNEIHLCHTQNYLTNSPKKIFQKNSIVFPKNGGAVFTNKKRILIENSVVDLNTGVFTPTTCIDFDYVFLIFSTIDFREHYKGTALPTINNEFMNSLLFGLPPLAEQTRIVKAFKEIEPFIVEYDKLEQQISKLDSEIYDKLKKSILQYAIQGKLVPQDENDEPVSELLKRIRAEKKAQLGKKYVDSYIYKGDDNCYYEHIDGKVKDTAIEVPFDLPNNWTWCRLDNLALYKKGPFGSSLTKDMFVPKSDTSIKVYEQKNAIYKDCTLGSYYISEQKYNTMKSFEVFSNDIIVSCAGTIGETYILPHNCPKGIINQALMKITLFKQEIVAFYLLYFDYILKIQAQKISKGSAIKNIPPFEILKNMLMPIPPIAEQQRIVDKINEIFVKL